MKALTQKGYDVNYSWGMNNHGQKFGGAIMPEMMRWLWRDGPVSTDPKDTRRARVPPAGRKEELGNCNHASMCAQKNDFTRATGIDGRSLIQTGEATTGSQPITTGQSLKSRRFAARANRRWPLWSCSFGRARQPSSSRA